MDSLEVTLASMEQMMEIPSMESLLHVLQQCRKRQNLICAQLVHVRICDSGLDGHRALGNYLVPMFVNFGRLSDAQQALDRLVSRNEHSWTSLIQGFVDCGQPLQALNLYQKMEEDLVYPSQHTSVAILKACSMLKSEGKGRRLHVEIAKKGYERDSFVGNALVDLYARCGLLVEAQKVFDQLLVQDVVLWNTLMTGYAENGLGEDVLHCLDQMQLTGVSPDAVTFLLSLKACGSTGAIDRGRKLHAETAEKGLEGVPYLGSIMVDMYAKCGLVEESQKAFDHLQARDVVTWTSLIRAYAKHGLGEAALHCLEQMQLEEVSPNAFTFACSLGACASIGAIDKGREIHTDIVEKGLERGSFVCNSLVDMYAKFGLLGEAWKVFDKLPVRDVVSWNIIIAAYAEHGLGVEALNCLEQMQQEGVSRDSVTYICSLKACGSTGVANKGQEVHLHIAKHGLEKDLTIGNTLVDMYAKCGSYAEAQSVFDELSVRDVVSWTALIAGFAEQGSAVEALVCFEQMRQEGVSPDEVTFVCSLKACSSIGALEKGQELHAEVIKEEFETDFYVGNILVDLYAKCGSFIDAQAIFDELPVQDVASWNALITGLSEHGLHEEALDCLEHMQFEGVRPNIVSWNALIFGYAEQAERDKASKLFKIMQEQGLLPNRAIFVSILKACGDTAAREFGKTVHAQIYYACRLEIVLANALIDMYSRCGSVVDAQQVFDSLPTRVLGTWNALITGYARQGEIRHVFNCLEKMKKAGILPDAATFLNVLSVCSHGGLVEKGKKYFEAMYESYCLSPTIKHHNCMVDLLGRAGQVDEAVAIVEKIPFQHDSIVWSTVLGAFRKWGHHHELGKVTFEHPADLDKNMLENSC